MLPLWQSIGKEGQKSLDPLISRVRAYRVLKESRVLVIFFFPYNPPTPRTPTNPPPVPPRKLDFSPKTRTRKLPKGKLPKIIIWAPGSVINYLKRRQNNKFPAGHFCESDSKHFGSVSALFRLCFGSVSGPFRGVGWGRG